MPDKKTLLDEVRYQRMGGKLLETMPVPIVVVPAQAPQPLQERAGVTTLENQEVDTKIHAHIHRGGADQQVGLTRRLPHLGGSQPCVRQYLQPLTSENWPQTFSPAGAPSPRC